MGCISSSTRPLRVQDSFNDSSTPCLNNRGNTRRLRRMFRKREHRSKFAPQRTDRPSDIIMAACSWCRAIVEVIVYPERSSNRRDTHEVSACNNTKDNSRSQGLVLACTCRCIPAREATLVAHWLHEPQPISDQPVWLGFPHHVGRHRPGGSAFSSPGCWSCRDMEGGLIRG